MQFEKLVDLDVAHGRAATLDLGPMLYQDDINSIKLGVRLRNGSEPVEVEGDVVGRALLSNGATITIESGEKDGSEAWVVIPQAALEVPGRVEYFMRIYDTDTTAVALYAYGYVRRTATGTIIVPGDPLPDVEQLRQIAADCEAATETAQGVVNTAVQYTAQTKTAAEKAQARGNIGAAGYNAMMKTLYKVPAAMLTSAGEAVRVLSGGISTSGGDTNSTTRCRTQYCKVLPGRTYALMLADTEFVNINLWQYTGTTGASAISSLHDIRENDGRTVYFTTDSTANYIRACFAHKVTTTTVTEQDRADVQAALTLQLVTDESLSVLGAPADAAAVGTVIGPLTDLLPKQRVSWDEISAAASESNLTLGWKVGYWDSENSFVSNTTACVAFWTYLSDDHGYMWNRTLCKYIFMTAPEGTTGRIKGFTSDDDGATYTVIDENITFTGTYALKMNTGTRYRIYLSGLTNAATWLTEANVRTITLEWTPWDDTHHPSPGKASKTIFFTVDVDRPVGFEDKNATTSTVQVQCAMRMPDTYRQYGKPTRMIFMAHGAHGYIDSGTGTWYSSGWIALCSDLLDEGYGVFDANVLPGTNAEWVTEKGVEGNWAGFGVGSPLYVQAVKAAWDYIQANYNVYPQIFAHGTSMGGTGATAFATAFPQLVLAESSFAGRDIIFYLNALRDWINSGTEGQGMDDGRFATAWGYASLTALISDKFSHIEGTCPSITLTKLNADGTFETPPDRETEFSGWLDYFAEIYGADRGDDVTAEKAVEVGNWIGWRKVPYKCWNSWADNLHATKLEQFLRRAFRTAGCCYNIEEYDTYSHDDMCFGQSNAVAAEKLPDQLIAWYKRWE